MIGTSLANDRTELASKRTDLSERRTSLAKERNDLASNRTVFSTYRSILAKGRTDLALIRTGFASIALGIGLIRFFGLGLWTFLDGGLVVIGIAVTVFAVRSYIVTRTKESKLNRAISDIITELQLLA